jgi:uncharacterized protein HemX
MDNSPVILPFKEKVEVFKTAQEEVYKSALEIISALCDSYSTTTSDIKSVCKTVLKIKEGNEDE